jgi:aldehyde dehydrogenase (NAD+)
MEIDDVIGNLSTWMKPKEARTPMGMAPATSEVQSCPFGVSLIIAPFNYPISLCLGPLISSVAAGNCSVVKPSEMTPNSEKVLAKLIPKYLDTDCVAVLCGGIPVTGMILKQQFDKIFFTGSTRVGKIVMKAAAEHLTPVTMELGGKSPCIINNDVTDMALAVKRIMWGKFCNAGQTCIAPDYVLCHEDVYVRCDGAAAFCYIYRALQPPLF